MNELLVYRAVANFENGNQWISSWHRDIASAKRQAREWKQSQNLAGARVQMGVVTIASSVRIEEFLD